MANMDVETIHIVLIVRVRDVCWNVEVHHEVRTLTCVLDDLYGTSMDLRPDLFVIGG